MGTEMEMMRCPAVAPGPVLALPTRRSLLVTPPQGGFAEFSTAVAAPWFSSRPATSVSPKLTRVSDYSYHTALVVVQRRSLLSTLGHDT